MPATSPTCPCGRSLATIAALFGSLAAAAFLAEDACLDAGGRVSDVGWLCEHGSGATSLWSQVTPTDAGLALLAVGIPVYWAIAWILRAWLLRSARPE